MQTLSILTETLDEIKHVSMRIVNECLPLMKELAKGDSNMIDEIWDELDIDDDQEEKVKRNIDAYLKDVVLGYVTDSENILKEIDIFTKAVSKGDQEIEDKSNQMPFFSEVWFGDAYDSEKIDGLLALLEDLKDQVLVANEDTIFDTAVAQFSNE